MVADRGAVHSERCGRQPASGPAAGCAATVSGSAGMETGPSRRPSQEGSHEGRRSLGICQGRSGRIFMVPSLSIRFFCQPGSRPLAGAFYIKGNRRDSVPPHWSPAGHRSRLPRPQPTGHRPPVRPPVPFGTTPEGGERWRRTEGRIRLSAGNRSSSWCRSGVARVAGAGIRALGTDDPPGCCPCNAPQNRPSVGGLSHVENMCARAASASSRGWALSPHHVRKLARNPCSVVWMPCRRSIEYMLAE